MGPVFLLDETRDRWKKVLASDMSADHTYIRLGSAMGETSMLQRFGCSLHEQNAEQTGDCVAGEQQFHDELIS